MRTHLARVLVVLAALCPAALAERRPVLEQIDVPHNYYYREMYLPQATSGPSAAAWSPDGRHLVLSMQGTLWRHPLGTDSAEQLTDGPGYDYQPDWSPDGRFVVYASYRDDAVELRMLDLATRETWPVTENRAVNVEPRWSPDGRRIAFVSTVHNRRWHLHTIAIENGRPGAVTRLTEDVDSRLPRYYYSKFDHELSPAWSPDGTELLFVSNRGHIWGSGGFWRMKAEPGAAARELRYEETTWKARPDWSPDGKRVVYSSYLGRQWNQLWVMTAEGGDPFPLTYGEFDATAPRWSPDGRRIAYISNQEGNTALWILDLPGGKRAPVQLASRRYLNPTSRLRVEVVDRATGQTVPARVSVTGPDGRSYAPDDAWRHADDYYDRSERKIEYGYFHTPGTSELTVPAGAVDLEVARGLEYRVERVRVAVAPNETRTFRVALERLADLRSKGWTSGDLHVHMNYGGAYRNDPARLAFQAEAEDLAVVENLIVNKEQRIPDVSYFDGNRRDPASTERVSIVHGQEFHTSMWGHLGLIGLSDHLLLPDYSAYVNTAAASPAPTNATVADMAREQGALVGYVHPFDTDPNPVTEALANELPVDVALGKVDYYEVVGFSDHLASAKVWYRLLNCGFRIPTGAGTDAMANFASLRGPVGMCRVYARAGARPGRGAWLGAIRAGRTFATNGPLLELSIDGREVGDELKLEAGREVEVRAWMRSIAPVEKVEVVANGEVVATLPLSADRMSCDATVKVKAGASGWYTLRAWSPKSQHPVLDIYPFATTSPVYVTVAGRPVRSRADAEYFVAWVDRIAAAARAHAGWNTAAERDAALADVARARAVFARLAE
jgi:Tol biopolymer transport system component